jgi:hypothetical protein
MIELKYSFYKIEHMFTTGDLPLLVTCSDFSDWVCKHGRMSTSPLFNEVIGSRFAEIWGLKTPHISLIQVSIDHLPDIHLNRVPPAYFNKPCFGSSYIEDSVVIDKSVLPSFRNETFKKKIANKTDLLKIALFDIWLGNEDRHHGNTNLLLDESLPKEYYLNVFDHGAIFNSNALKYGLELISDNESLICSELVQILFERNKKLTQIVDNIIKDYYLCISECHKELNNILQEIPLEWGLDLENLELLLNKYLFSQEWCKKCENHFRALIQANL